MPPREASAPGSIGKEKPGVAEVLIQLFTSDTGLHPAVQVFRIHFKDLIHIGEIDSDAAAQRLYVPFKRSTGPEGDDGHVVPSTKFDDCRNFFGRVGEAHGVRRGYGKIIFSIAVLVADGGGCGNAVTQKFPSIPR